MAVTFLTNKDKLKIDQDISKLSEAIAEQGKMIPKVFDWANAELPFTEDEISDTASGAGFVVNPENFADGKTYFRYHAGATNFTWTNPNPKVGAVTLRVLSWKQWDKNSTGNSSSLNILYSDGTTDNFKPLNGVISTFNTNANKVLSQIKGNYDIENWILLDMDVLSIVADYPAPTGTVKSINGNLPDANGNVKIDIPESDGGSGGTDIALGISGATVGQIARITAVDDSGVPTAWESADIENLGGTMVEPAENDIPKVFLTGDAFSDMTNEKNEVQMGLEYISKTESFVAYIKIKFQGTSSLAYAKKNFTIKLYNDENYESKMTRVFRDWGVSSNKYVLKANFIDHSHSRNIISANLWTDVVAARADYGTLPERLRTSPRNGAVDGFPIKLYVNGTYQGIYTWNIGKDDWMFGMEDDTTTQVVLCAETNPSTETPDTTCNFRVPWNGVDGSGWSVEVGKNSATIKDSLNALITFLNDASDAEVTAHLNEYIDVQSAIDYYLHMYVICGMDNLAKNMLLATYDGVKWYCSAYDMDTTYGINWTGSDFVVPTVRCPEDYYERRSLLWERIETCFTERLKERYFELRKTVYSIPNMFTAFERFIDIIGSDLLEEDVEIYPSIPSASENNITQIRNFIRDRVSYVDEQISAMTTPVYCTGITLNMSDVEITGAETVTLTATVTPEGCTDNVIWGVSPDNVVSVVGGNVVPIANGTAVITATCGDYSATCNVTVTEQDNEELLYSSPQAITLDGLDDDPLDTGVVFCDGETEKTLCIAFTPATEQLSTYTDHFIVGFTMSYDNGTTVYYQNRGALKCKNGNAYENFISNREGNESNHLPITLQKQIRIVITYSPTDGWTLHCSVNATSNVTVQRNTTVVTAEQTMVIAGVHTNNGSAYTRKLSCTVHNAAIYGRILTDEEIQAFLTDV